jgi:hypothetical protein
MSDNLYLRRSNPKTGEQFNLIRVNDDNAVRFPVDPHEKPDHRSTEYAVGPLALIERTERLDISEQYHEFTSSYSGDNVCTNGCRCCWDRHDHYILAHHPNELAADGDRKRHEPNNTS